jgi:hypothetical protein
MKRLFLLMLMLSLVNWTTAYGKVVSFDDLTPTISYSGGGFYENGPNMTVVSSGPGAFGGTDFQNQFSSGGVTFNNTWNDLYDSWSGWAYSSTTDLTTAGFANQYSAYNLPAGGGHSGANYGVFSEPSGALAPTIDFGGPVNLGNVYITNTTYAYKAVVDGDDGGAGIVKGPFEAGDFFKVTVTGYDRAKNPTASLEIFLADYRDADSDNWYALDTWSAFDLSALGTVHCLSFDLDSSDTGQFGMNTPAYFAMDDLQYDPVTVPLTGPIWLLLFGEQTEE